MKQISTLIFLLHNYVIRRMLLYLYIKQVFGVILIHQAYFYDVVQMIPVGSLRFPELRGRSRVKNIEVRFQ